MALESFARGGGGGSGGGTGGIGGIYGTILLFGYAPMHFSGAMFRRWAKKREVAIIALSAIGFVIAIAYATFWVLIWTGFGPWIALAALLGMPAGLYGWFGKLRQSKYVSRELQTAAANDPAWNEQTLTNFATAIFMRYQQDWSDLNTDAMKTYLTPEYHQHATLLVGILRAMGRQDRMENVEVQAAKIVDMHDFTDQSRDDFTIGFTATAKDQLYDTTTDETLFTDNGTFTEYWRFVRNGATWLLAGIQQQSADLTAENTQLAELARQNGYFYSLDMGWLFIPKRGRLFGQAKFGTSDINNHVVGLYNNQLLVQVYSFETYPANRSGGIPTYVIAQVSVPKQYGEIIVRRNKLLQTPIFGLKRVETEWTQFNKKYEVYASAPEQATSFELLNPTYMEQLEALPFEVNIEVVDNVIYLYTKENKSTVDTYQTMLDLVNKAFKELRL